MEISSLQIVLVFLVGCLSGMGSILDEFQTHRPLIACTLTGLVLGDMTTGIIIGGTLEMMALGWMNIGAALAPDAALASIISTILVIAGKQEMGTGIALAIPLAAAGQVLTILVRTITVGVQHAADNAVKTGNLHAITWLHLSALLLQAMRVAITGTIVAVFLPVSFTGGMIGQYFSQFGTTVSAAVLASLLTARLATPLLAAYLLAPAGSNHHHKPQGCLMRAYLRLLEWTLRHRKTTLSAAALILAASWQLLPLLPTGFMPRADTGFSQLNINLPPGSTLAQTDATLRHLSDITNRYPAVAHTYTIAGTGGDTAKGEILIRSCPHQARAQSLRAFEQQLRDTSPPSPTSASPSKTKKPSATSRSSSPARTPPPSAQPRTPSNNKYSRIANKE